MVRVGLEDLSLSAAARGRMLEKGGRVLEKEGRPFFTSSWNRVVFIHYRVDPETLQREVPFELDLWEGNAYVSLVAFTFSNLRPRFFGRSVSWLGLPFTNHGFLNVRTYVRVNREPGIYFLAEWLSNPLSVWIGPSLYGLPYRFGRLQYRHRHEQNLIRGSVTACGRSLHYQGRLQSRAPYQECATDSLDEFLLERYSAFTRRKEKRRVFRVWHAPWPKTPLQVEIVDGSLVSLSGQWFERACFAGAHYSPGVDDVWVSPPRRL